MKKDLHIRSIDARRYEMSTNGWKVTVVKRSHGSQTYWNSKTRIYGAVDALAADAAAKLDTNASRPAYGEGDGFTDEGRAAHLSEYKRLKSAAIAAVKVALVEPLIALHEQLGRPGTDVPTTSFSMRAGCSTCPCSPGFILNTRWTLNGNPVDVWFESVAPHF